MRAALYARFSTDKQSETSLVDQFRLARERCAALGLTVVAEHGDDAISGSTPVAARAAGKALLADALAGRFDVLVLEGIDRLSREIGEQERIVKRLEHRGIRIVGISDGYDSQAAGRKVMRIARGLVNELYIDDLRAKTHRGLVGQIARGFHAGGISYGYRSIDVDGGHRLQVHEIEADVVRRIFAEFVAGASPQRIAHGLNRDRVPSPRGGTWAVSGIYGSPAKGSGILNNEIYIGRYVWNRSQWLKDPDTGRRQRVDRPQHEWRIDERPELRVVDDVAWQAVRRRIGKTKAAGARGPGRPARTLFGGLLRCAHCGGAVIAVDGYTYGCAARKDRGPDVCTGVRVKRKAADGRLLAAVRDELMAPAAIAELRAHVRDFLAAAEREAAAELRGREARRQDLRREIERLVDAIASVGVSEAIGRRLTAAEAELAGLEGTETGGGRHRPAPARTDAEIEAACRRMLLQLEGALAADVDQARALLADRLGPITIRQEGDEVWAEVSDRIGEQLLAAAGGETLIVVAGGRFGSWNRRRWRLS